MKTTRNNTSRKHGNTCNCADCKALRTERKAAKKAARFEAWSSQFVWSRSRKDQPGPPGIYAGGHPDVKWIDFEDLDELYGLGPKHIDAARFLGRKLHELKEYPKLSDRFSMTGGVIKPTPVLSRLDRVYTLDIRTEDRLKAFDAIDATKGGITYLYHGTKCRNINSIIRESLNSSGKSCLLGPGVYLAPDISKALGFAGGALGGYGESESYGIVLICAVKLGYEDENYRSTINEANALLDGNRYRAKNWIEAPAERQKHAQKLYRDAKNRTWDGDYRFANAGTMAGSWSGNLMNAEYCVRDARRVLPKLALVYKGVSS